ncbi:MAG: UDP-galactopyranose mutase [Rikenellaceae bacterium]
MGKFDYIVVGAGLYGATFANIARSKGKSVLVVDKRDHVGGNIYCEEREGISVHKYGAHIFHTSNREVWQFLNNFVEFNRYTNAPVANHKGELYNLPFNMNTFYKLWGSVTPAEALAKIEEQRAEMKGREPQNLEEQAISLVGRDIYEKLIKGYTEKQWGRECRELPAFIIKRLPVRFTFDNNYFSDRYQGIPVGGYNALIEALLGDTEVRLGVDFFEQKEELEAMADKVVFTGAIDQYFDYCYGKLEYRTLRFEHERIDVANYQGNAVVNYTEREIPYTRIIEHKHFSEELEVAQLPHTIVTREYPSEWVDGSEPYYPVNDAKNQELYERYSELAQSVPNVLFGGRLGQYKYFDMHHIVEQVLSLKEQI